MLTNEVRSSSATWEWTDIIQIVVAKSKEKKKTFKKEVCEIVPEVYSHKNVYIRVMIWSKSFILL